MAEQAQRVVIVSIASAAESIARELLAAAEDAPHRIEALGLVLLRDEDERFLTPCGLPVLGTIDDLETIAQRTAPDTAVVCLPSAFGVAASDLRVRLAALGIEPRFRSVFADVLAGRAERSGPVELDLEALIGRAKRTPDADRVRAVVTGKRVLITGAGGSIGSELARLCLRYDPAELILMDRSDNALFEIGRELNSANASGTFVRSVLHDVIDAQATLSRFESLRPEIVFHAAAHKHVPLMQDHPAAAVANNLFGTKSVADAARHVNAERFVMVSTDKAVRPTSVMGATKRLAELYVRSLNATQREAHQSDRVPANDGAPTRFSLVRFGNVLGSACSVLPIWQKQIAEGGSITVTDARMTRFFMTIPEAAALVVQAAGAGDDEVYVLDMGEPVPILDLARRFLRQQGFTPLIEGRPDRAEQPDEAPSMSGQRPGPPAHTTRPVVPITFTGTRPGEKLYEELAYTDEELRPTSVDGVLAWRGDTPDPLWVQSMIRELSAVGHEQPAEEVIALIGRFIPELNPIRLSEPLPIRTVSTVPTSAKRAPAA